VRYLDGKITTFVNPYSYLILRKQRPAYLDGRTFQVSYDGIALALIARVLSKGRIERLSFDDTSLAPKVFKECAQTGGRVSLIGSGPGVATQAAELLQDAYPSLELHFVRDGYFEESDVPDILSAASECDLVICSMGTPKQEDLLAALKDRGWKGTGYTCGGYLDQLVSAGGGAYYPRWIDKLQLRWLYRLAKEPRRLAYRYFIVYPQGILRFTLDKLSR